MRAQRTANERSSDDNEADGEEEGEIEVFSATVIDLASTKMAALASAVHVAAVLLKVDQAIDAG
ncbi:hypothetical protein T492DRAFT_897282 [Pavlovales sp. CCMP2436]|nr:hypothetical protein T492DRAFT_897282 [Pavlovales sp. CCMP2436]